MVPDEDDMDRDETRAPDEERKGDESRSEDRSPEEDGPRAGSDRGKDEARAQEERGGRGSRSADRDGSRRVSALAALQNAKQQLTELIGHPTESVSASKKTDDGWDVTIEVVELERIPSSTDVLASYQAMLDGKGNVTDYKRTRRYYRNRADEGE